MARVSKGPFINNGKVSGKFWLIQSDLVDTEGGADSFGNTRLKNPGRSIQPTKEGCIEACKALSRQHPGRSYFVMEAVEVVSSDTPVSVRKLA